MTQPLSQRLEALLENLDITEVMLPFHMRIIEEAMALAKRVETAPTGEVWQHCMTGGQRQSHLIITREPEDGLAFLGVKVALVTLEEP
jgi:hypothetical protein